MSTLSTTLEAFRKQSNLILRDDTHAKRRQACWDAIASLLDIEEQLGAQEAALARRPHTNANRELLLALRGAASSYEAPVKDDAAEVERIAAAQAARRAEEIAADQNLVRRDPRTGRWVCDCDEPMGDDWLRSGSPPCPNCGGKISGDQRRARV